MPFLMLTLAFKITTRLGFSVSSPLTKHFWIKNKHDALEPTLYLVSQYNDYTVLYTQKLLATTCASHLTLINSTVLTISCFVYQNLGTDEICCDCMMSNVQKYEAKHLNHSETSWPSSAITTTIMTSFNLLPLEENTQRVLFTMSHVQNTARK